MLPNLNLNIQYTIQHGAFRITLVLKSVHHNLSVLSIEALIDVTLFTNSNIQWPVGIKFRFKVFQAFSKHLFDCLAITSYTIKSNSNQQN